MACLILIAATFRYQAAELTLDVQPNSISNDFRGSLALRIRGLAPGEEVVLERYADLDQDGTVGTSDRLMQSLPLRDGFAPRIGEVRNPSCPADDDAQANGEITVQLPHFLQPEGCLGIGCYLFRVMPKTSAPATAPFQIRPSAQAQRFLGQVTASQVGVAGAIVFLLPQEDASPVAFSFSDAQGNYTLPASPGSYLVGAIHPDYIFSMGTVAPDLLAAGVEIVKNLELKAPTQWISGTVLDHDTKTGIPGFQILVSGDSGGLSLLITDGQGRFRAPGVSPAVQCNTLAAQLLGYATQNRVNFVEGASGETELLLELFKGTALLQGRFLAAGGTPIPYLKVEASIGNYLANTITDAEGYYSMALPQGEYQGAWVAGFDRNEPVNWIGDWASLVLKEGQVAQANFELRQTIHLRGKALTSQGQPLVNAFIRGLSADATQFRSEQRTDQNGNFDIPVYEGKWYVQLSRHLEPETNYVNTSMTFEVKAGQDINDIAFVIPIPTARIVCKVLDRLGKPVSGIQVFSAMAAGAISYLNYFSATTDENGLIPLPAIAGRWVLMINNAGSLGYNWVINKEVMVVDQDVEVVFVVTKTSNLAITTQTLPNGMESQPYDFQLAASGGKPPYTWSLLNTNGLPAGLVLEPGGRLHGIPRSSGYSFYAVVSDAAGGAAEANISLAIAMAPRIKDFRLLSDGRVMFYAAYLGNRTYVVERSYDLSQWTAVTAPAQGASGAWIYQAHAGPHFFYRIALTGQ